MFRSNSTGDHTLDPMAGLNMPTSPMGNNSYRTPPSPALLNAVPAYDGYGDPLAWLSNLRRISGLYNWDPETCLTVAEIKLVDTAQRWVNSRRLTSWEDFQAQFIHRFGETRESAIARLERCCQGADESPQAYADRFLQYADRAGKTEDSALLYQFIRGLNNQFKLEAARQRLQSIEEVVGFCNYWQSINNAEYSVRDMVNHYEDRYGRKDRPQPGYRPRFEERDNYRPPPRGPAAQASNPDRRPSFGVATATTGPTDTPQQETTDQGLTATPRQHQTTAAPQLRPVVLLLPHKMT